MNSSAAEIVTLIDERVNLGEIMPRTGRGDPPLPSGPIPIEELHRHW